jgi:hypothetical protein
LGDETSSQQLDLHPQRQQFDHLIGAISENQTFSPWRSAILIQHRWSHEFIFWLHAKYHRISISSCFSLPQLL